MGIPTQGDASSSMWDSCWSSSQFLLVTHFHKISTEMTLKKKTGELPLIFPFQSLPPLPLSDPSCPCYPAHLPPLPPSLLALSLLPSIVHPSVLCWVCAPLLTSVISSCHPTLRSLLPDLPLVLPDHPLAALFILLLPCYSPFLDTPLCSSLLLLLVFISSPVCSSPNQNSNHPQSDLEMQLYLAAWYSLFSVFIIGRL